MADPLFLSQASVTSFLSCKRRYQIRYRKRLPWPDSPYTPKQQVVIDRGQQFHQILERFLLGLPIDDQEIQDEQIKGWWQNFQRAKPQFPQGKRLPEQRLTVPIGDHFLIGRFDLLIIGERSNKLFARIYDWKTSRPRPLAELKEDWQSRLYLAMLAESQQAFTSSGNLLKPENISITYWFAGEPDASQTIRYDEEQHAANWSDLLNVLEEMVLFLDHDIWPLTDNWSHCRTCLYQTYCGRQEAGLDPKILAEDAPIYEDAYDFLLEPDSP